MSKQQPEGQGKPRRPAGAGTAARPAELPILLGEVTDGVTIQDASGRLIYANAAAAVMSGFATPEEMLAAPPGFYLDRFELLDEHGEPVPPEDLPGRRALKGDPGAEAVLRFRNRATDEVRWSVLRALPLLDSGGGVTAVINLFKDVTAPKRAEEALRFLVEASTLLAESLDYQTRLAQLAHLAVPRIADWCAVDILDEGGSLRRLAVAHQDPAKIEWAYELQRRYPPDRDAPVGVPAVIRSGASELYTEIPDDMLVRVARDAEHLEALRSVGFASAMIVPLTTRGRTLGAITLVATESGRRYGEADLHLAEDLARRAATAIDNARLFHDLQQSQEALEQQAAELEEVAVELEATNEELLQRSIEAEAANRVKAEFLAMMSHELRTPLNVIAGYVDLLQLGVHGPITEVQREDLRRIQLNQHHLLGVINDVLSYARLESGRIEVSMADVRIEPVLAGMYERVEPEVRARRLEYAYTDGLPQITVRTDAERLRQILLNLLTNAVKFTPPGGRIELGWEAGASQVLVRVRDTGRGIPADKLQAIFEPFVQLDATLTREASGVGLGLAISRDLARAMGGDLWAESAPGAGSTFVLMLPRGPDAEA
jgi:signal transduction histidine kinase